MKDQTVSALIQQEATVPSSGSIILCPGCLKAPAMVMSSCETSMMFQCSVCDGIGGPRNNGFWPDWATNLKTPKKKPIQEILLALQNWHYALDHGLIK